MTLHARDHYTIPEETARVAKGDRYPLGTPCDMAVTGQAKAHPRHT
jgi:hypothetical protein